MHFRAFLSKNSTCGRLISPSSFFFPLFCSLIPSKQSLLLIYWQDNPMCCSSTIQFSGLSQQSLASMLVMERTTSLYLSQELLSWLIWRLVATQDHLESSFSVQEMVCSVTVFRINFVKFPSLYVQWLAVFHLRIFKLTHNIPYSEKLWQALNLANRSSECIGEF